MLGLIGKVMGMNRWDTIVFLSCVFFVGMVFAAHAVEGRPSLAFAKWPVLIAVVASGLFSVFALVFTFPSSLGEVDEPAGE